jgi:FtsZ-binding cell division protein ZapB
LRLKEEDLRLKEEDLRRDKEDLRREKEDLRREKEDLRRKEENLRLKKEDFRLEEEDLRRKEEDLRRDKEDLQNRARELRGRLEEGVEGERDRIQKMIDECYLQISQVFKSAQALNVRTEALNGRLEALNVRTEALNVRTEALNVRTEALNGRTEALDKLANQLENERVALNLKRAELLNIEGSSKDLGRVANIDFQIDGTPLKQNFDLSRFLKRIDELFQWYSDKDYRNRFMAPYFPLVQSSGTGKTKLLYEAKKSILQQQRCCALIHCVNGDSQKFDIFDHQLHCPKGANDNTRVKIWERLDQIVNSIRNEDQVKSGQQVVLLFDEAQHLLGQDGFDFRCVRWWMQKIHPFSTQVVAVFTGTSSGLALLYAEPPKSTTSRDASGEYYKSGEALIEPFYDLCTMGLFGSISGEKKGKNDYEVAIPFGRPLFAKMQLHERLNDQVLVSILRRMCLSNSEWTINTASLLSILATRVQMGQTSLPVASSLVKLGYAHLTFFLD